MVIHLCRNDPFLNICFLIGCGRSPSSSVAAMHFRPGLGALVPGAPFLSLGGLERVVPGCWNSFQVLFMKQNASKLRRWGKHQVAIKYVRTDSKKKIQIIIIFLALNKSFPTMDSLTSNHWIGACTLCYVTFELQPTVVIPFIPHEQKTIWENIKF